MNTFICTLITSLIFCFSIEALIMGAGRIVSKQDRAISSEVIMTDYPKKSLWMILSSDPKVERNREGICTIDQYERKKFNFVVTLQKNAFTLSFLRSEEVLSFYVGQWSNCPISPGIFKESRNRCPSESFVNSYVGFSVNSCDVGFHDLGSWSESIKEEHLNILEITYDENGNIESFAANVLHEGFEWNLPPIFMAIRYNSQIPVEVNTVQLYGIHETPKSFIYCIRYPEAQSRRKSREDSHLEMVPIVNNFTSPMDSWFDRHESPSIKGDIFNTTSNHAQFDCQVFKSSKHKRHLSFKILNDYHDIELSFNPPKDENYVKEFHKKLRKRKDTVFYRDGEESYFLKEYRIRELEIDASEIVKLAIDFIGEAEDGKIIEGSLRHETDIPVNLENPYNR